MSTNRKTSFGKRLFDLIVAIAVLVICAPFLIAAAFAIKLNSAGPIFFTQERIGKGGRIFRIVKFRTMADKAPDFRNADGSTFNSQNDPRVTRVGAILRRTSFDEIPQLWNVLRGEMSLVGPRPELPDGVETYLPAHFRRLNVLPGMTGWAVAHGRNDVPVSTRRELDTWYADHAGFWLDIKILAMTIALVARSKGIHRNADSALTDPIMERTLEVQQCSREG